VSDQGPSQPHAPAPAGECSENGRTFAIAHLLERRLVAERIFARLDDEGKTSGNRLGGLGCF